MKTIGDLRKAIYNLPDNAPLGVEIQTNGGDDLEFTSVDGIDVSSEKKYRGPEITEEVKSVNLIVTSDIPTERLIEFDSDQLRDELADRGYATECLWRADDVFNHDTTGKMIEADALFIMNEVMKSEWLQEQINMLIQYAVEIFIYEGTGKLTSKNNKQ